MSDSEFPFDVPPHEYMIAKAPGKMPLTVLTIEQMLYSVRICEYTDPLFIGRAWWYESVGEALAALANFTTVAGNEPQDWLRADDFDEEGRSRTRRAHVEFGERVITVAPKGLPAEI